MPEENNTAPVSSPPEPKTSVLDKNVPNPLAKNPNVHTHKVFASVALILIGVIVILSILAYLYRDQVADFFNEMTGDANTVETTKVSTSSAIPATGSASNNSTQGWMAYEGTLTLKDNPDLETAIKFGIMHPANLKYSSDEYDVTYLTTPNYKLIIGPENKSDFSSSVYLTENNNLSTPASATVSEATIGGKTASKAVYQSGNNTIITYTAKGIGSNNWTLVYSCAFMKDGDFTSQCETMASTFKFL